MKGLIIAGAGGHGRVCADIAARTARFDRIAFSDNAFAIGTQIDSWMVEFHDEDLAQSDTTSFEFLLGLGQVGTALQRATLYEKLLLSGCRAATIVAPTASVAMNVKIGKGTLVGLASTVNIGAIIGTNVIVNTHALIEHDAGIGDHAHISTGAIVNGNVRVGERCLVGSGAVILHGVSMCSDVVIGAGAVVTRNIDLPGVYVGVPARKIDG